MFLSEFDDIGVSVGITDDIYVPFSYAFILHQTSDSCLTESLAKSNRAPGKVHS